MKDRQIDRQTDWQTERKKERKTGRRTERQKQGKKQANKKKHGQADGQTNIFKICSRVSKHKESNDRQKNSIFYMFTSVLGTTMFMLFLIIWWNFLSFLASL